MQNINFRVRAGKDSVFLLTGLILVVLVGLVHRGEAQVGAESLAPPANKTAGLRFEVASIRPAISDPGTLREARRSGRAHTGTRIDGDRVDIGAATLMQLIIAAYSVRATQVDGPAWLTSERFDVLAKLPPGATKEQVPEMLRALLEERFKLVARRISEIKPVYALVVGPKKLKLEPPIPDGELGRDENDQLTTGSRSESSGGMAGISRGPNGDKLVVVADGLLRMEYNRIDTKTIAEIATGHLDRPVVDMTGLQGTYHVALRFSQNDALGKIGAAAVGNDGSATIADPHPSLFSAIEELGLKLESRKAPVERILIDHVEKEPTAN